MSKPLNPGLYARLRRHFGPVKIVNEGQAFQATAVKDVEGARRLSFVKTGEYYRINCPRCGDTRFRLYVNHMYGQRDAHGRWMKFLAVCYNEHCLEKDGALRSFAETLADDTAPLVDLPVRRGVMTAQSEEFPPPGPCTPLHELPLTHPACAYLAGRGFDPDLLGRYYGVGYCEDSRYSLARNRIYIPVWDGGKLRGWQCRYVGELDWKGPDKKTLPPKYFTCPGSHCRSQYIYGWETMREWRTGVLVEGPMDRWGFGPMAGSVFGNTVTDHQMKKIIAVFRKRSLVFLLDPEEFESARTRRTIEELHRAMPGRFAPVKLPEGTDPGSLERSFQRAYVREQAAVQGVTVSYTKEPVNVVLSNKRRRLGS